MSHTLYLLPVTGNYISELIILIILKSSTRQPCGYKAIPPLTSRAFATINAEVVVKS
jgi:hypothetical protein